MAIANHYSKRLARLQNRLGLKFEVSTNSGQLTINGIPFSEVTHSGLYSSDNADRGILIKNLSPEERRYCENSRISFYDLNDNLQIFGADYSIRIQPNKKTSSRRAPKTLQLAGGMPEAALFVSPNGLKILDALFKLSNEELEQFKSALSFSNRYGVNQPKLSKILRTFNVRDLLSLKKGIQKLPDKWWIAAFASNINRKGMSPFFSNSKPHYSLLSLNSNQLKTQLIEWEKSNATLVTGPLAIGESLGFLRDDDISYWGTKESLHQLKTKFKLIPGVNKEKPVLHLATPRFGFSEEAILSQIPAVDKYHRSQHTITKINSFRAAWDLGFGTERLKELQILILRKIMNEL